MAVVVISGQSSAGNTVTAKLVSEKLSLNRFSPGQLFKDLGKGTVKRQHYYPAFQKICEEKNITIPEFRAENDSHAALLIWNPSLGKNKAFHEAIDELSPRLASQGNIVIDGKLAIRMVGHADLKVWLKASIKERARRINSRDNLGTGKAEEILLEKEAKEREGWKNVYGFDYLDQEKDADIVIDTTNLTPREIAEKILEKIKQ